MLKPAGKQGPAPLQPDRLLPDAVAEIASPDFPGERLLVCLNPRLREERARKREDLLRATEAILEEIARVVRQPQFKLRGRDRINRRVGREANRRKVEKHFQISVSDDNLTWARDTDKIAAEAQLDGIYIVRTSLPAEAISVHDAVYAYKSLAQIERAFRNCKISRLEIRPDYVYSTEHVRAHVFLCALACYVEWNLRRRLAPILFEDHNREGAKAKRTSPVQKAEVSDSAKQKADTKITPDGLPVSSMRTLLDHLGSLTLNQIALTGNAEHTFNVTTEPTPVQQRAFQLLKLDPKKVFPGDVQAP